MRGFIVLVLVIGFLSFLGCEPIEPPHTSSLRVTAYTSLNCAPCRANEPRLRELEAVVPITRVDVDRQPQAAANAGVRSWPTYILFVDEQEIGRTHSINTLARWISSYGQSP